MKNNKKYIIIILLTCCMIAVIIYIRSKLPNDKYRATVYASTEEIMQNFEANKSNKEK